MVSTAMAEDEVQLRVDLGLGDGTATAWGCDLTTGYVHINADYTT
jgi:glutamate N-acetyltransferase / amino-acid N-acetyltransferase